MKLQRYLEFFQFFSLRQALIPLSTVNSQFWTGPDTGYSYMDIYVFGFRVIRIHKD